MVALSSLKPGMVVYSVGRQKMGNTTISQTVCWPVRIIEIHDDGKVTASWNGNKGQKFYPSQIKQWRLSKPAKKER